MDSNSDTCTFGKGAWIVHDTGRTVSVDPFLESLGSVRKVKIITAAVAYDDPTTYQTYILFFNEALYIPSLKRHLLCPNQLRTNHITVNDTALIHTPRKQRNRYSHSIVAEAEETFDEVHIPLRLEGQTTSYFMTRKPTQYEIDNTDKACIHVHMTPSAIWEPSDETISELESSLRASLDNDLESRPRGRKLQAMSTSDDEFSIFSATLAHTTTPEPEVSETASHRVQISKIRRQNASAEVDIDSFAEELERVSISAVQTKARKGTVSPETLAKRWHIGVETARKTIENTTQLAVRDFTNVTGSRRLKPIHEQLKHRRLDVEMYCDILEGKCVSLLGNRYTTVYCTPFHWISVDPMEKKGDAHKTLDNLFRTVGVPRVIIPDGGGELKQGEFARKASRAQSNIHPIEAYTPNANIAEDGIRELKRAYRRAMISTNTPACLWDLCLVHTALIRQHTVNSIRELQGRTPAARLTGDTDDISFLCEFGWYDYVWFSTPPSTTDGMENKRLGRYCGPSINCGDAMSARILTDKARFVDRTSVFPIKEEEWATDSFKERVARFEASLKERLKDRYNPVEPDADDDDDAKTPIYEPYQPTNPKDKEELPELAEADDFEHESFDRYISSRVKVPRGDDWAYGTVKRRKRDADGNLIGHSDKNPWLDSSIYEVELDGGQTEAYSANIIAEHIYSQVDEEGFTHFTLSEITDHKKDPTAVAKDDAFITMPNGQKKPRMTTKGWHLCCQWNDGSTSWHPLKDLKESHPIQVAEYAVNNKLLEEPAFNWWASHTLKKRDRIISKMKKRYFRRDQKYGIELPKTVQRALEIDKENGNTFWRDAIHKEMKNNAKAFKILEENAATPVGHTFIKCHMVFDIKQGSLQRKARLVAGGHMTDAPPTITYASVVSRESVRIAFLIAALNDLDIEAADIGNAYLNAPPKEKVYIKCGAEFGEFEGRLAIIVRALYGLKSSASSWRSFLARVLDEDLNFTMCRADNDVWFKPSKKADGTRYYIYVLVYTDDILCLAEHPKIILDKLDQHFLLKPESRGKPKIYLGAEIGTYKFPEDPDKTYWTMGSQTYVKESVKNVEAHLQKDNRELKSKVSSPLPINYAPELDGTELCDDDEVSEYHSRIGILRWAVELGRIDICTEVSIMAAFAASPRNRTFGSSLSHLRLPKAA